LSREERDDRSAASDVKQDRTDNSQTPAPAETNDYDSVITIANHKDTLQSFIERSPLGVQFAILVLFYLARTDSANANNRLSAADNSTGGVSKLSPFSFTSKEFFDKYSQLASDLGLTKYLLRHMAFAESMLTLEYLALVREDEVTANYRFGIDFEDLKWLASLALQQIAGGHSLSSPETSYLSASKRAMPSETIPTDKTLSPTTMTPRSRTTELIKELSLGIFSRGEIELNSGDGTSKSYDDFVRPRSRDYGLYIPFFPNRVPPTMYSFRKPDDGEWKRIIKEFFEGQKCVTCNAEVSPHQFDVWIGIPLEDNVVPSSKRDQRMSDVLTDTDNATINNGDDDVIVESYAQSQTADTDKNFTDRELLTYSYGIIPMDGRDAFIAFAKPKKSCPTCGANPSDSVSLMPKY
jgi:hypothetical protein